MLSILIPLTLFGINCKDNTQCIDVLYYTRDSATLHSTVRHVELDIVKEFNDCNNYLPLIVASFGILAGGMCFKLGKVACKIMTQIMDYSLPFCLSTPVAIGVVIAMYDGFMTTRAEKVCYLPFPLWAKGISTAGFFKLLINDTNNLFFIGAAVIGFFSLLLITNHVWMPGKERLQRTDKYVLVCILTTPSLFECDISKHVQTILKDFRFSFTLKVLCYIGA